MPSILWQMRFFDRCAIYSSTYHCTFLGSMNPICSKNIEQFLKYGFKHNGFYYLSLILNSVFKRFQNCFAYINGLRVCHFVDQLPAFLYQLSLCYVLRANFWKSAQDQHCGDWIHLFTCSKSLPVVNN